MPLGARIDNSDNSDRRPSENVQSTHEKNTSTFRVESPKYKFSEIILNDDTYDSIQDMLSLYSKRALIFGEWGLGSKYKQKNRIGINMYGPPGTGKTMAAHAIADQNGK